MDIKALSCSDFVHALGSASSTPGGGGAAAMAGAIGIALGDMVACFTIGKKKYAEVEEEMISLKDRCLELENELLDLINEDAAAFAPLAKAYGMPSVTEEEKAAKAKVMESCLKEAAQVPLRIMRLAGESLKLLRIFAEKGSSMMISDAGCGAVCCRAALQAGALNVMINTRSMKDREYASAIDKEVSSLLEEFVPVADDIFNYVAKKCR